jgi:tetratricopeptide (TPR) repeat protein
LRGRKLQRDLGILLLELAEQPDHPFTLFNLGQVYKELGQTREALAALTGSLKHSAPTDSIVRKLYSLIAQCHLNLGDAAAALAASRAGKALFADDVELLFQEGVSLSMLGDLAGAAKCWEECLRMPVGDFLASINPGLRGYVTRDNLARTYRAMKRSSEAEEQWRTALSERPYYEPAWRGLMDLFVEQRRWPNLEALAQKLKAGPQGVLQEAAVRARILLAQKQFDDARQKLQKTIESFPQSLELRLLLSYTWLQEGRDSDAAEQALLDVLKLAPEHAETLQNLKILRQERAKANGANGAAHSSKPTEIPPKGNEP